MSVGVRALAPRARAGAGGHMVPARGALHHVVRNAIVVAARQHDSDQIETFANVVNDAEENKK